ncbi:metallophosphoesterase family protein [Desulfoplanes formicivorans]|uniref:Metallophosphoesterase n=1 Tax=Desulfoplanes formicivorans TaxID=1592317 RepID=A0A194AF60_9BACT|nr:DNA repair exonuclease [Desulfoplanes formicivorans]GAU07419.1 metallophosphoesterase [Desulfoplanes formicivorans]
MLKFIHAADIHLDSPLRGLSRYESAPVASIRNACRRALENLVDLAIEEQVAFVLLAGDLYDGDWKDYSTGIFFSRQMGRLDRKGIRVIGVAGNHDAANTMTRALAAPANMTLLASRKPQTVVLDECNVAIHGQSFKDRHVQDNLVRDYPAARPGMFNIGLVHTSLDGREGHGVYAPCSLDDLRARGYQYWALGHVHKREIVSNDPWVVFSGCIQGRHIRETGDKGCMLVTVEDTTVIGVEPVALDVFRWAVCPVDLNEAHDANEISQRIRTALQEEQRHAQGRPLAVRVCLQGATRMAEELAARSHTWLQRIRMLGAEIGDGDIWVERMQLATSEQPDRETRRDEDSGFAHMLNEIEATPCDFEAIPGVAAVVDELVQKLPVEAVDPDSGCDVHDPETVHRLVDEAKQLLVGRLMNMGGKG